MCFPGAEFIPSAAQGVMQGLGSLSTGRYQAAVARHGGKQALLAANLKAQQVGQRGTQEIAAMRRAQLGSGNLSWLDFIADQSTNVAQEVALAKYGGQVAAADAKARANYAQQQAWHGFANSVPGIVSDVLRIGDARQSSTAAAYPRISVKLGPLNLGIPRAFLGV